MQEQWLLTGTFFLITAAVWKLALLAVPGKGFMLLIEKTVAGIFLCWLCQMLAGPFGIVIPQTPFAAIATGSLGLPGMALAAFLASTP
ncbi:MAG: pro-sigmaK processing inhibitor BofA family protein [Clostridia bacterium]|nr:pro-sigmaK processing inhibitor BofA family protein [Clostridia bacterium]